VIHGYVSYDTATAQQLATTASLVKEIQGKTTVNDGFIKQFYDQEIMSSKPMMMKFSTAVTGKLK
jgi:hypothetical protein